MGLILTECTSVLFEFFDDKHVQDSKMEINKSQVEYISKHK